MNEGTNERMNKRMKKIKNRFMDAGTIQGRRKERLKEPMTPLYVCVCMYIYISIAQENITKWPEKEF